MAGDWRNRIVGEGMVEISSIVFNPRNWRVHPRAQQDALSGVLGEIGWIQRVIINARTGNLIDGHARVAEADKHGETEVPAVFVDLDEAEEAYALATLDPVASMAVADRSQLDAVLREVQSSDAAVQAMLASLAESGGVVSEDIERDEPKCKHCKVHCG